MTRACIYTYIYIWIYTCICTYVYVSCCAHEWCMSHLWMSCATHKYRHDANWYCTRFWREMKRITCNKQVMSHAINKSCHTHIHRHDNWLPCSHRRVVFVGDESCKTEWMSHVTHTYTGTATGSPTANAAWFLREPAPRYTRGYSHTNSKWWVTEFQVTIRKPAL